MKTEITMNYEETFLPTSRHKRPRTRLVEETIQLDICELTEDQFPLAFTVTKNVSLYDDVKTYDAFSEDKQIGYVPYTSEIRCYNGNLYKACNVEHGAAVSTAFEDPATFINVFLHRYGKSYIPYIQCDCSSEYKERISIIKETKRPEMISILESAARKFCIFEGKVWYLCGEPVYEAKNSFNGTSLLLVKYTGKEKLERDEFNALQVDNALLYMQHKCTSSNHIEVYMPEMVRSYKPKYLDVCVSCMAYYGSKIELPKNFDGTLEEAIAYAKENLSDISLGTLEYIHDSDQLDEENCNFSE